MHVLLRALLGLAVLVVPNMATAQEADTVDAAELSSAMHTYFDGEKDGGAAFMTVGSIQVVAGAAMVAFDDPGWLRPAGYPLLVIGALEVTVGAVLYARTDAQVAALDAQLASDPRAFVEEEGERMRGVDASLMWVEIAEGVLVAGGIATAIAGFVEDIDFAKGFGLGLAGSAATALGLDLWASARAEPYLRAIDGFAPQVAFTVGPDGRVGLVAMTRF